MEIDGLGAVGLSVCFDGDHPAYARRLRDLGARIVIEPAAYETPAETWWDVLYPANALVNGQWWVMANQCGGELLGRTAADGTFAWHFDTEGVYVLTTGDSNHTYSQCVVTVTGKAAGTA